MRKPHMARVGDNVCACVLDLSIIKTFASGFGWYSLSSVLVYGA